MANHRISTGELAHMKRLYSLALHLLGARRPSGLWYVADEQRITGNPPCTVSCGPAGVNMAIIGHLL